jgi:hypothetical protein
MANQLIKQPGLHNTINLVQKYTASIVEMAGNGEF